MPVAIPWLEEVAADGATAGFERGEGTFFLEVAEVGEIAFSILEPPLSCFGKVLGDAFVLGPVGDIVSDEFFELLQTEQC